MRDGVAERDDLIRMGRVREVKSGVEGCARREGAHQHAIGESSTIARILIATEFLELRLVKSTQKAIAIEGQCCKHTPAYKMAQTWND